MGCGRGINPVAEEGVCGRGARGGVDGLEGPEETFLIALREIVREGGALFVLAGYVGPLGLWCPH